MTERGFAGGFEGVVLDRRMAWVVARVVGPLVAGELVRSELDDGVRGELRAFMAAVTRAAAAFENESSKAVSGRDASSSAHEISRDEAAVMLGVTPARVSQMLPPNGPLGGRKVANRWLVDAVSVQLEAERREVA